MVQLDTGITFNAYPNLLVYVDPLMDKDTVLVGRKGADYSSGLLSNINTASNAINNPSRKGSPNFVIVSSQIAETLNVIDKKKKLREERKKKLNRILGLSTKRVSVGTRQIKATWIREMAEDLMSWGRIDPKVKLRKRPKKET